MRRVARIVWDAVGGSVPLMHRRPRKNATMDEQRSLGEGSEGATRRRKLCVAATSKKQREKDHMRGARAKRRKTEKNDTQTLTQ